MLITLPGWVAAQNPTPSNNTTSIRYTLTAPTSTNWTAKDFDDSAWTKTEDAASIPAAVPKDGEVWIRIRCELPWELINNNFSMPNHNWGVGIAVADKPEGQYRETSPDKPICPGCDAQIFRDDDGQL